MPIAVSCECGAKFAAKDEMAGKRAKCPKCQAILVIPAANSPPKPEHAGDPGIASLLDEVGLVASKTGVRCPSCRADMQPGAILCIQCGFNTQTGKKLETKLEVGVPKPVAATATREKVAGGNAFAAANLPFNLTWAKLGVGAGAYVALCVVVALFSNLAGGLLLAALGGMVMLGIAYRFFSRSSRRGG